MINMINMSSISFKCIDYMDYISCVSYIDYLIMSNVFIFIYNHFSYLVILAFLYIS